MLYFERHWQAVPNFPHLCWFGSIGISSCCRVGYEHHSLPRKHFWGGRRGFLFKWKERGKKKEKERKTTWQVKEHVVFKLYKKWGRGIVWLFFFKYLYFPLFMGQNWIYWIWGNLKWYFSFRSGTQTKIFLGRAAHCPSIWDLVD